MSENSSTNGQQSSGQNDGLIVPDEARKKYPDLVELVIKSESMNREERNYWLQVLPVMTDDQVAELSDILQTEKKKLAAIDAKYAGQGGNTAQSEPQIDPAEVERKRREAREQRWKAEQSHREQDEETAEDLLAQLEEL